MKRILTILAALFISALSLSGQDVKAKNDQKKKLEEEITFINSQLKGLSAKQKSNTKTLALIKKKAANRKQMIASLDAEIGEMEAGIADKSSEIEALQRKCDTLRDYYGELIYNTYKNRNSKMWFMYILSSQNIGQGYRRMAYIKNIAGDVNARATRIRLLQERIAREKGELETKKAEADNLRGKRKTEYTALLAEEKETATIINNISRDKKKYQAELARKRKQVAALNSEIERLLKAAVKEEKTKRLSAAEIALTGEFEQNRGKLGWPVKEGVITERFGVHFHPVYKNLKLPENNGITITTSPGAEALCVFDGIVKQVIIMPGYGHCVLVQHGRYFTFYCKLKNVKVKTGQKVGCGQSLGVLEDEGNSSQIHFQIWNGVLKQDPEKWLSN